jgi:hypothetical protein
MIGAYPSQWIEGRKRSAELKLANEERAPARKYREEVPTHRRMGSSCLVLGVNPATRVKEADEGLTVSAAMHESEAKLDKQEQPPLALGGRQGGKLHSRAAVVVYCRTHVFRLKEGLPLWGKRGMRSVSTGCSLPDELIEPLT